LQGLCPTPPSSKPTYLAPAHVLHSDPTPTFSHTCPFIHTPSYETSDTWDCITIVSDFPDTILLTPLISFLMLPLKPSLSLHCYALGHTPLTSLVSSTPIVLMETPQSFGLQLGPIRLTSIPLNTLPSVTSISALLTTLMVVTNELSSYLLILSHLSSLLISY
jgi:hypothetical protein